MKVLITGFDPFGGETVNPAYEAVKLLPDVIAGANVIKVEVPTVFGKAAEMLEEKINEHRPDIVLCIGQAGGRPDITIEKVAINYADARICDNEGSQPLDATLREDGDTAYFATVPVKAMVTHIREAGIPASVSYTAGTFVCNELFYSLMYLIHQKYPHIKGGFIHVPYSTQQAAGKPQGTPSMSIQTITAALTAAVESTILDKDVSSEPMGTLH